MNEVRQALAFASRIDEPGLTHSGSPHLGSLQNEEHFRNYRQDYTHNHFCDSDEQEWADLVPLSHNEKSYYYHPARG